MTTIEYLNHLLCVHKTNRNCRLQSKLLLLLPHKNLLAKHSDCRSVHGAARQATAARLGWLAGHAAPQAEGI